MHIQPSDIAQFALRVQGMPLYPYQLEVAQAILDSVLNRKGYLFTVMMSRQSGKNQLSAVLEAFLLAHMQRGTIVKAAPTFNPQITNSRLRLLSLLGRPELRERLWQGYGRIIGLAPEGEEGGRRTQAGPRIMFFSASPTSNVVGATADLLLEIDETQEVEPEKFDRDFRPMCATSNATTVLYGTAWTDQTLLAQQREKNIILEEQDGVRRHFEYDWRVLAAINPAYRTYVEQEIERLGESHIAIQTQYLLKPINEVARFLNDLQLYQLQGQHPWEEEPGEEAYYIAGMDVAGEERLDPAALVGLSSVKKRGKRDSTVISIARVQPNEWQCPEVEVVHQVSWTGMSHDGQYHGTVSLMERWRVRTLIIDATGLGAPLASMLQNRFSEERVRPFVFTAGSKSRMAYSWLALINGGRFRLYRSEAGLSSEKIAEECWKQLRLVRHRTSGANTLDIYVDPAEGHDDIIISLALLSEAVGALTTPAESTLIRPKRLYGGESRF